MSAGTQLVRYDAMCSAITAAYSVDEVKDIRDKTRAMETYFRLAGNTEAERQACEIRLRAERKAGLLLAEMDKAKGGQPYQSATPAAREGVAAPLADLGITHKQSAQWQQLGQIPEDDFERALAGPTKPSTSGIITAHAEPKRDVVGPMALWLWGRLQDFERDGLLDADPDELVATMFGHMQMTTKRLAPRVAAWLGRIADVG